MASPIRSWIAGCQWVANSARNQATTNGTDLRSADYLQPDAMGFLSLDHIARFRSGAGPTSGTEARHSAGHDRGHDQWLVGVDGAHKGPVRLDTDRCRFTSLIERVPTPVDQPER